MDRRGTIAKAVAVRSSLVLLLLSLGSAGRLWALQTTGDRVVPPGVACQGCRIEWTAEVTLGLGDTLLSEWPQSIARDRRGRYYLTLPNRREMPMVFAPDGRYLRRLGRPGDGPGEMRYPAHVAIGPGDTVFVADWAARLVVFDPEGRFVRQSSFPPGARGLRVLADGTLLLNANVGDRATIGKPFHLFRPDGERFAALGDSMAPYRHAQDFRVIRRIWPDGAQGFWAAPAFGEYLVERWTRTGLVGRFLSTRSWFTPARAQDASPDLNGLDRVAGIFVDERGRLWAFLNVADRKRGSAGSRTVATLEGPARIVRDWDRHFDTVVEVIDPASGRLLATRRLDERVTEVLGGGRVARVHEDANGRIHVSVLRFRLVEQ